VSRCIHCKTDVRGSRIECVDDRWLHDDCYSALRAALREAAFDIAVLKRAHDDVQDRRKATEAELEQAKQWSAELKQQLLECKAELRKMKAKEVVNEQ
jgi:septal ring factor EnvC (AmiA/AmiB activator)